MIPDVIAFLRFHQRPLLISHIAPDGDAIGSLLGLGWVLRTMGKQPTLACADSVATLFRYLPEHETILREPTGDFDAVIGLDSSDEDRLGAAYRDEYRILPLLNIDHHVTNLRYGTVNWVVPEATATAEIVFELVQGLGIPLDSQIATYLMNGIVTDTRGFRTGNTTPRVLDIAHQLYSAGASLPDIAQRTLDCRPLPLLHLWGEALSGVRTHGQVVWTEITRTMRVSAGHSSEDNGGLVNMLLSAEDASVAVVFSEKTRGIDRIEISLRSKLGVDVTQVALALGGGGHPQAAGATIDGSLPEVRERVLYMLAESLSIQDVKAHSVG